MPLEVDSNIGEGSADNGGSGNHQSRETLHNNDHTSSQSTTDNQHPSNTTNSLQSRENLHNNDRINTQSKNDNQHISNTTNNLQSSNSAISLKDKLHGVDASKDVVSDRYPEQKNPLCHQSTPDHNTITKSSTEIHQSKLDNTTDNFRSSPNDLSTIKNITENHQSNSEDQQTLDNITETHQSTIENKNGHKNSTSTTGSQSRIDEANNVDDSNHVVQPQGHDIDSSRIVQEENQNNNHTSQPSCSKTQFHTNNNTRSQSSCEQVENTKHDANVLQVEQTVTVHDDEEPNTASQPKTISELKIAFILFVLIIVVGSTIYLALPEKRNKN